MALFFTHIVTANGLVADPEGEYFDTLEHACAANEKSAKDLVASAIKSGKKHISLELHIENEQGPRLAQLPLSADINFGRWTRIAAIE